eukprot:CAMPEP_0184691754 /NCGR_PEP_ID=MMETSP0313-20130426/499_1 /TAXON_ID=2792 /ORGANISM="Porphyridium aerugineum, Strain SAG 1380-2" /LENGTH=105 /DNA_ID=CAMNT_0027149515 /DNA_START=142 /DNA_END=459 /DNA_ORIENTATION=-
MAAEDAKKKTDGANGSSSKSPAENGAPADQAANSADAAAAAAAEPQLEVLEEEDDFEEFNQYWDENAIVEEDEKMWQDDWDDEEAGDHDFVQRLREELSKTRANA